MHSLMNCSMMFVSLLSHFFSNPSRYLLILCIILATLLPDLCSQPQQPSNEAATAAAAIINKDNGNIIARHGKSLYLIANGVRHEIATDRYTRDLMRQCKNPADFITLNKNELNQYIQGPPVQSLWDHHPNIPMLSLGSSPFIEVNRPLLKLLNPSMVYYKIESTITLIVSWRVTPDSFKVVLIDHFVGNNGVAVEVTGDFERDFEMLTRINLVTSADLPSIEMPGEDPRLFHLGYDDIHNSNNNVNSNSNDDSSAGIYVVFCRRHKRGRPELQMAYFKLIIERNRSIGDNKTTYKVKYDDIVDSNFYRGGLKFDEKNWSPLQYKSKLLFIEAYSPMHRVVYPTFPDKRKSWVSNDVLVGESFIVNAPGRSDIATQTDTQAAHVVGASGGYVISADGTARGSLTPLEASSLATLQELWPYGEIRGGTPAYRLPHHVMKNQPRWHSHGNNAVGNSSADVYLSFFHSSLDPYSPNCTGSLLKTYSMGAYTFEASPPFKILSMSRKPIIHPDMYSGPWTDLPMAYYHIDYVVFPTTYIYSPDRNYIHLIYGTQDNNAMAAKLNLLGLIESLDPVKSAATATPVESI